MSTRDGQRLKTWDLRKLGNHRSSTVSEVNKTVFCFLQNIF